MLTSVASAISNNGGTTRQMLIGYIVIWNAVDQFLHKIDVQRVQNFSQKAKNTFGYKTVSYSF